MVYAAAIRRELGRDEKENVRHDNFASPEERGKQTYVYINRIIMSVNTWLPVHNSAAAAAAICEADSK